MNIQEIAEAYNAVAKCYGEVRSATIGLPYLDNLCDLLPEDSSILDVGCGTGVPLTQDLVDRGFRVHGIDISPHMIKLAIQNVPDASFELADIVSWTAGRTFNGILAWDSLFHLKTEDQVTTIRKIHDALTPNGVALLTFGGKMGEILSSMLGRKFYYNSLSTEEYTEVIDSIGFNVISIESDQPGEQHIVITAQKVFG